jgi:serine/threonine-protein kinase HipA
MSAYDITQYRPVDTLYLWWLGKPGQPVLIGTLATARTMQGVSLRYAPAWLAAGFALSEDLPLIDKEFLPTAKETAVGAIDDARPDRWGERVIRFLDKPPRLSVMDFLFLAGDSRFGALGVSVSAAQYVPRTTGPLPIMADVPAIDQLVQQVLRGEPIPENQLRLIVPGGTLGGARPKALLNRDGELWIVKFNEPGEALDVPLIEHASMTLAEKAGIRVAQTQAIPLARGHALAVKRFDRDGDRRVHALSANVALKAAGEEMGYPELAQILRRRGISTAARHSQHMAELFRRMVFNILIDNTDDHEKNHVLLMNDQGAYALSPAFDVLPSAQALGYQQMRVGQQGSDATLANALSCHRQFGLDEKQARSAVGQVAMVVEGWKTHFRTVGVKPHDIESLERQIDRPFLKDQRVGAM